MVKQFIRVALILPLVIVLLTPTFALSKGNADVRFVRAVEIEKSVWTFHVTVFHPDTGWKDYANGWDVVLPDNTVLKIDPKDKFTRVLWHPHETEQPFTRSQRGLKIPTDIQKVWVRAHDIVDGFGGKEVVVDLAKNEGERFKVQRLNE